MTSAGGLLLSSLLASLLTAACTPRRLVLPDTGAPDDSGGPDAICPHLHVAGTELSWDDASADGTDPQAVTITNLCAGVAPLVISVTLRASGPEVFSFDLPTSSLAPSESTDLAVSFNPIDFDTHAAVLELASNAADPSSSAIILTANAVVDADGDGADSLAAGGEDCDDRNAEVYPGAAERWHDGVDNDCDGLIDQFDTTASMAALHGDSADYLGYRSSLSLGDLDGDGGLDLAVGGIYTGPYSVSEGGVWLVDGAGLDGVTGPISDYAHTQIIGSYTQNYLGPLAGRQGDVDGSGADDLFVVASDRYYASIGNVAAGLFFDPGDLTGTVSIAQADVTFLGSYSLYSLSAGAGMDLDGDGLAEVVYGDWWSSTDSAGAAYVFQGSGLSSGQTLQLTADADLTLTGVSLGDSLGCAIGAGDLDEDGYEDLLVSAPQEDLAPSEGGALYLVPGGSSLPSGGAVDTVASLKVYSASVDASLGYLGAPQIADLAGDGGVDLVVSSPSLSEVYVFFDAAGLSGELPTDAADLVIRGDAAGAFGASLATGDLLGGGGTDLAVGAPDCINLGTAATDCDQPGTVYVFAGPDLTVGHLGAGQAGLIVDGTLESDMFGASLVAGDLTGDGRDELLVSAPGAGSGGEGYLWIFSDPG